MGRTLPVLLVVAAHQEAAKKYAELVRLSGIGELDIRCLVPPRGLTGFIEYLKQSVFHRPYVLLTADVFSNCETKPSLNIVLKNLSGDKSLGLRIFVVRTHEMGTFKPDDMIQAGASGVYYGAGISDKDFKDWIKRVWDKPTASVHQESAAKRTGRSEEKALVDKILGDDSGGSGGGDQSPHEGKPPSAPSSASPEKSTRTPARILLDQVLSRQGPSAPITLPGTLPAVVPPAESSWLFSGRPASKPTTDDENSVVEDSTVRTETELTIETKPPQTGEDTMQLSTMVSASSQNILLRALATACIAFGNSINEQMTTSGKPVEDTSALSVSQVVGAVAVAPKEEKGGASQPSQDEQHKVVLEPINGRRTRLKYNGWDLDLTTEKADLLRLFIESNGKIIPHKEIGERYGIKSNGSNIGVNQKVGNLVRALEELKPELAKRFETKRGKGYRFQPLAS